MNDQLALALDDGLAHLDCPHRTAWLRPVESPWRDLATAEKCSRCGELVIRLAAPLSDTNPSTEVSR